MSISSDLMAFGTFASCPNHRLFTRSPLSKVYLGSSIGSNDLRAMPKWRQMVYPSNAAPKRFVCLGIRGKNLSTTMQKDAEGFLLDVVNMSFLERLSLVWKILFPTVKTTRNSNASIAKQRLKMILFSDRCAVSDEAKKKIVSNIVDSLSEFVVIDSQDKVQLNVSADTDIGTVYSVSVPVRRVKPEYQESEDDFQGKIMSIDYKDTGEMSGTVDVKFDFYVPNEN